MIYMHNLIKKLPVREPHQMIYGNLVKPVRHLFYDSKLQLGLADIKKNLLYIITSIDRKLL